MKQTFDISENCKATVEQTGNQIVITFEPNKVEFKKCDFVSINYGSWILIGIIRNRSLCNNVFEFVVWLNSYSSDIRFNSMFNTSLIPRFSTPQERQLLIDKLESEGWKFNEEKCELEKIRWVPNKGDIHEFITSYGTIDSMPYSVISNDNKRLELGNCFKPKSLDPEKVKKLYAEFIEKVKDEHGIDY